MQRAQRQRKLAPFCIPHTDTYAQNTYIHIYIYPYFSGVSVCAKVTIKHLPRLLKYAISGKSCQSSGNEGIGLRRWGWSWSGSWRRSWWAACSCTPTSWVLWYHYVILWANMESYMPLEKWCKLNYWCASLTNHMRASVSVFKYQKGFFLSQISIFDLVSWIFCLTFSMCLRELSPIICNEVHFNKNRL